MITMGLAAGVLAALLCIPINHRLIKHSTDALVWAVPIIEEAAKTGLALVFRASVPFSHIGFGIGELLYDGLWLGGCSIWSLSLDLFGHGLFGLVTYLIWLWSGSWFLGVAGACVLHSVWNGYVDGMRGR